MVDHGAERFREAALKAVLWLALVAFSAPVLAQSVLPPEQVVRTVLENLPQVRASAINIDLARAGKSRLDAGTHEWTVRTGLSRRTDQIGGRYNEQDVALERSVRWFGKAAQDRAIGDKGIVVATSGHEDAWHEAGRTLLTDWFSALREMSATERLDEQVGLAAQLRAIAEKRVKAGDAAQIELLQADTESARVGALLQQAQLRREQALQQLATNYPGLPVPHAAPLPIPVASTESGDWWRDKITSDNHELELAQGEADLLGLQAARVSSERMPDPTIGVRAGRERDGQERLVSISILFTLPGAGRSADRDGAVAKAGMATQRAAMTQMKVSAAAQRVVTDSQRSLTLWQTMQRIADQSAQQSATMMRAYTLGEASLTDALTNRRMAMDAALAAESAQIDALAAQARLSLDAHLLWSID
ncbi:TolC family protein [Actimicrobium sp. CCI2.3]|uniref:TolC family protein n=1 Tax=Actimicrobium sp. CCI2.3 TaxID=3048616 RepID=UPI002AB521BE|nr:TolC family protein [Actimicrobium sp. CCI2.3]MDY7574575.1 TolC family protein [Actimicrobium sp. CCI2.3]MEB0020951.1 TolC family protein [Actimicrobium sp. CCI2.3]